MKIGRLDNNSLHRNMFTDLVFLIVLFRTDMGIFPLVNKALIRKKRTVVVWGRDDRYALLDCKFIFIHIIGVCCQDKYLEHQQHAEKTTDMFQQFGQDKIFAVQ